MLKLHSIKGVCSDGYATASKSTLSMDFSDFIHDMYAPGR